MAKQYVTKENKDKSDTTIFRAKRSLRERFIELSNRRKIPTINLINKALEEYLKNNEYILEDIMKIVDNDPSLILSKNIIENELNGCPSFICSGIINTISNKTNYIFLEKFDNILNRIISIDKKNIYQIYIHFSLVKFDTNKINDLIRNISENLKDETFNIDVGIKEESLTEDKALIFVSYNKREEYDRKDGDNNEKR
ncbi:MAG: hypothetical protein WC867_04915 [Candidatus Pacearchaeota archaeon]